MKNTVNVGLCPVCKTPTHINKNFKHGQTFYCECGNIGHVKLAVIWEKEK